MRDGELVEPMSRAGAEVGNIYGAPKAFMRLRALGVRASRKRAARIMRERGWRGVARVRQKALGREAGLEARIGGGVFCNFDFWVFTTYYFRVSRFPARAHGQFP